jgi:hypothetical protein
MLTFASDQEGFCRCYRCGVLLYNPDAPPLLVPGRALPLTIDRIIPGCHGGTYRRNNIRPACGPCNSETGGGLWARKRSTTSSNSRSTTAGA